MASHGNAAVQSAAGTEIVTLINNHSVSAAQVMTDIGSALTSHNLTPEQTINVFTIVASHGDATVRTAIGAELAALIGNGSIVGGEVLGDLDNSVSNKQLTAAQAVGVVIAMAAHGDLDLQTSAGGTIGDMIGDKDMTSATAMAYIGQAFASHLITGAQTISLLAGAWESGDLAQPITNEFDQLVGHSIPIDQAFAQLTAIIANGDTLVIPWLSRMVIGNFLTSAEAAANLQHAVTTNVLTGAQAVTVLVNMAANLPASQAPFTAEIASLVSQKAVTAKQAVTVLAAASAGGSAALQSAGGAEIAALINNHSISAAAALAAVTSPSSDLPPDQSIGVLANVANHGGGTLQHAIGDQIATMIGNGSISVQDAIFDLNEAMTNKALTAANSVGVLAGMAAHGDVGVQLAVGAELSTLISNNQITAAAATTQIDQMVSSAGLNATAAVSMLTTVASVGTAAVQTAMRTELSSLIAHNYITADQTVTTMASLASGGTAAMQFGVGIEIAALIGGNKITAAAAMTDIEHAMTSNALTSAQALAVLASMNASTSTAVQTAVTNEIASLIDRHVVTTNDAIAAMAGLASNGIASAQTAVNGEVVSLIKSGHLTADQTVAALAGVAASGNATLQVAAGAEIALLIGANQITAAPAIADVDRAVTSNAMSEAQAVSVLIGLAASGSSAVGTAATAEIASLIDQHRVTVDQAVSSMAVAVANGNAAVLATAGSDLANLINPNHSTAAAKALNTMMQSGTLAPGGHLTADQSVSVLIGAAASSTPAVQAAAASLIGALIKASVADPIMTMAAVGKATIPLALQRESHDRGQSICI